MEGKNKKLILILLAIFSVAALLFVLKIFFFSGQETADFNSAQLLEIANAENTRIDQLNVDIISKQTLKDFLEYQGKITKFSDIKKGNDNPFEVNQTKNEKIEIDNTAVDKLFAEFTVSFGVLLNEEEKARCLDGITKQKLTSDKYRDHINACFTDKRNKILM